MSMDAAPEPRSTPGPASTDAAGMPAESLLVEDVLLLLFQPDSGSIAGENTLFYVLGGAVLADLALAGRIDAEERTLTTRIHPVGDGAVTDPLLDPAWAYISQKPRGVQSVLAAIGPALRAPVLDRLVERGDLERRKGTTLGIFPTTELHLASERRAGLLADVRAVLVDGVSPEPRTAAHVALLSASGTLPQFHGEIPWSGDVYTRGKDLERGDWGASAASRAVTRTMNAVIVSTVIAATTSSRQ